MDDAEDDADAALATERLADLAQGRDATLPAEISARLLRGDSLLRAVRKWKGVTQLELAARTGLTQGYLSDLETGRRAGSPSTLEAIAAALGVDKSWLA